ncbi:MAG: hypothetical protein ACO2XZ_05190 [Rickettsiales bacterium]
MVRYSVYSKNYNSSLHDYRLVKQKVNIWFLLFGPIMFLVYGMWFNLLFFGLISLLINTLYYSEILSFLGTRVLVIAVNFYLALDFANMQEAFLERKGYNFLGSELYHKNLILD